MKLKVPANKLNDYMNKEIGHSDWFSVDQSQINKFADVTIDHQFIHVDEEQSAQRNEEVPEADSEGSKSALIDVEGSSSDHASEDEAKEDQRATEKETENQSRWSNTFSFFFHSFFDSCSSGSWFGAELKKHFSFRKGPDAQEQ